MLAFARLLPWAPCCVNFQPLFPLILGGTDSSSEEHMAAGCIGKGLYGSLEQRVRGQKPIAACPLGSQAHVEEKGHQVQRPGRGSGASKCL